MARPSVNESHYCHGLLDIEFFELHFGDSGEYSDEDIVAIWQNVMVKDRVVALLASMHIAEGLTRGDK